MKDSVNTSINSTGFCVCEKCMVQTGRLDLNAILTSNPPKYRYVCDNCGNIGFISTYIISSTGVPTSANDDASVTASSECNTCVHKNICKYHDTLLEYSKSLKELELPEFLSYTLLCKYKQTRSAYSLLGNTRDLTKGWEDAHAALAPNPKNEKGI